MHLYEINPKDGQLVLVIARTPHEASDLFVTWSAANDRVHETFTIDGVSMDTLMVEQQAQVRRALAADLVGIAHFEARRGLDLLAANVAASWRWRSSSAPGR